MKRVYIVSFTLCIVMMMGIVGAQSPSDFSFNIIADEVEYDLLYTCVLYNSSASWFRTNMSINETMTFSEIEFAADSTHIYEQDLDGSFYEFPKLEPGEVRPSGTGYQLGVPTPEWANGSYILEDHQLSIEFQLYLLAVGLAVGPWDAYSDMIDTEGVIY